MHAFEQPHDGLGHDVGGAVPHDGEGFGVFFGEQAEADFAVGRQRAAEVDLAAVDFGQDGGLGQTGTDFGSDVVSRDGAIELFAAAIGQDYGKHGRLEDF